MPRHGAKSLDVAREHRHKALGIGRIASFDDGIEGQATAPAGEVELMGVVHLAPVLDDDIGMRLEQADDFVRRRHMITHSHLKRCVVRAKGPRPTRSTLERSLAPRPRFQLLCRMLAQPCAGTWIEWKLHIKVQQSTRGFER